ncbi:oxidative stress survival, Svf1-like protein [Mrakia frigida]|uniref:survival factor 1 family protein n=1 Tax=Mrakia frigida TaxID=29902 RepID=UPI003FCBF701
MSWFSTTAPVDPSTPNFVTPPTSGPLFGRLSAEDTAWACDTNKGFVTETQVWYSALEDGSWIMLQLIFSVTGIYLVPPTVQFVFKHYDPKTKAVVWKSVNLTGWKANGRGGKSNEVEIKHTGSPDGSEVYTINANLSKEIQISVTLTRPEETPGFKIGEGPNGGMSFFGTDEKKREGHIVSRVMPVVLSAGHIILNGKALSADGEAMFVHAVQGMRPNLVARRWNFAFFSSPGGPDGKGRVRAVQSEVGTTDEHGVDGKGKGRNKYNFGAVVVDGKLTLVTSQLHAPGETGSSKGTVSKVTHLDVAKDEFTGYMAPRKVKFEWAGPVEGGAGEASAWIEGPSGTGAVGEDGLIEKVDVLAEIPYVLKKVVSVVAGTKPYIFQHFRDGQLHLTLPGEEEKIIEGKFFDELTFISE